MSSNLRIVVTGLIAQYPLGGVAWDYLQYVLGLKALGHDVFYFEDTGQWPYNPEVRGVGEDCDYNVRYLSGLMSRFGLEESWAYRFPWGNRWFGLPDSRRDSVRKSADLLINVSGSLAAPQDYRQIPVLAYVDTDPVFTQVKLARGQEDFRKLVDAHDVHFSFGEHFSEAVPDTGHAWRPTRQPIALPEWTAAAKARDVYTTVMNWTSFNDVTYEGRTYGQKDVEFRKFLDLPAAVSPVKLEIAANIGKTRRAPREALARNGWRLVDPERVCPDVDGYRDYIRSSRAEWSVAKNGYVQGQAGWFSCRSACYLAAGRPVVVQETGFSNVLPTGEGVLAFADFEEAAEGIAEVEADYARHSRAARELAGAYFDAGAVLDRLVDGAMHPGKVER